MNTYLLGLLEVTAFIGAVAGVLVFLSLNLFWCARCSASPPPWSVSAPTPTTRVARIAASHRRDEIPGARRVELDRMQADLRAALNSRARLAALGEAVAKINHDLRNMLTSAQIASERLAQSGDPFVAAALPRLGAPLDRASALASNVLEYGKSEERAPEPAVIPLLAAVEAAGDDAGAFCAPGCGSTPIWRPGRRLRRSRQVHRVLVNLLRNAREAIQGRARRGAILISAAHEETRASPAGGRQRPRPAALP